MLDITVAEETPAKRLQRLRRAAGYRSAAQFVREISVNASTYYGHETGRRAIDPENAVLYARHLNTTPSAILYGSQLHANITSPIVGRIEQGGLVIIDNSTSTITIPFGDDGPLVCLTVEDDSLYPAYRVGDIVMVRPLTQTVDPSTINGQECVVTLDTGEQYIRQVSIQPDGLATLIAYHAPPIYNATIVAASPVRYIQRARQTL